MALIQLAVSASKVDNLNRASDLISKAVKQGAQLIALPVNMFYSLILRLQTRSVIWQLDFPNDAIYAMAHL